LSSNPLSILSSPFSLDNRTLWFGQIDLYENEVVISGWGWTGPVEERILLDDLRRVDKWSVRRGPNVVLHTTNGRKPIRGRIERGVKFWELRFKEDERVELKMRH